MSKPSTTSQLPYHGGGMGSKNRHQQNGWLAVYIFCTFFIAVNFWFLDCIVYGISKNFEFIWNVRPTKMHPSQFLHLPVWQCCTTSCQPPALLLFHGTGCTYGKQKFSVAQVSRTFQAKASLAYDGVIALGDRYRKFYRTLNNAKKPFNSIFNSKKFQPYSFKILFI